MLMALTLLLCIVAIFVFVVCIVRRDHGRREPKGALFMAMGFGVLAVVASIILELFFVPDSIFDHTEKMSLSVALQNVFLIGLIEEGAKCIPLALVLYARRYFDELTDGVIYFGIAALTFSVIEDIGYALAFGGGTGVIRLILSPYVHLGFTILFGIALAYRKVLRKSWLYVLLGFAAAVMTHALFDLCAMGVLGGWGILGMFVLAIVLDVSLFVWFGRMQKRDEREGRSAVGIHKFCRHCGKPNPRQTLYCAYCGQLS